MPSEPNRSDTTDRADTLALSTLSAAMTRALAVGRPDIVAALAQVVLRRLPRHLATYQRLLLATWQLKEWAEGEEWGRRLLQADPNSALAWRAVARGVEERGERGQARAIWMRAFEVSPYDTEIRAGLERTTLTVGSELRLNQACLATLYRCGYRWQHAEAEYRSLVYAESLRVDFLTGLMVALWRLGQRDDAYQVARHLVKQHQYTIMAWVVLAAAGDENDRALAHNPIQSMDPGGDYVRSWLRLQQAPPSEQKIARLLPNTDPALEVKAPLLDLIAQLQD